MQRQNRVEISGLVPKVRKRGCSSSSSASYMVHSYRFKRAILVGRVKNGLGRSGSQAGSSRPVSARKLAATLWEMNEVPLMMMKKDKIRAELSGPDLSHSPASERMDRSGSGSYQKRISISSHRTRPAENNIKVFDSLSSASVVEMDTRSHSSVSVVGVRNRLKDVSMSISTSKELLKIINRILANANPPSSSMSLVSALHAELERARLQVNRLINEQSSSQNEIDYLMKHFAEEKRAAESAIESIGKELEVERKLRRRSESLNKKLGEELYETKALFMELMKELKNEKRAREAMKQTRNETVRENGEDGSEVEDLNTERTMPELADRLCEQRVHMKLSNSSNRLKKQITAYSSKTDLNPYLNEDDAGEEDSVESDFHSIELNTDNTSKKLGRESSRVSVDEFKTRNIVPRSTSLLRSSSDAIDYCTQSRHIRNSQEGIDREKLHEQSKLGQRYGYVDEIQRLKSVSGFKDHLQTTARKSSSRDISRNYRTPQKGDF